MDPKAREESLLENVRVFHDRVEMMGLAFIGKHHRRPALIFANRIDRGWMASFVDPALVDESPEVHPSLVALAEHATRAWARWTSLEADEVVVMFRTIGGGDSSVVIVPRTEELKRMIAGEVLRQLDEQAGRG